MKRKLVVTLFALLLTPCLVLARTSLSDLQAQINSLQTQLNNITFSPDGPITGTLGAIDVANNGFVLITTGGDRCVSLDTGTHIFQIASSSFASPEFPLPSEAVTLADLTSGQLVNVYGPVQTNGCYHAHDVLVSSVDGTVDNTSPDGPTIGGFLLGRLDGTNNSFLAGT